jgi:hypothetical protein
MEIGMPSSATPSVRGVPELVIHLCSYQIHGLGYFCHLLKVRVPHFAFYGKDLGIDLHATPSRCGARSGGD